MITVKEIITVDRDDPRFDSFAKHLTKELGWKKEECTVSVSYVRHTIIGGRLEDDETY